MKEVLFIVGLITSSYIIEKYNEKEAYHTQKEVIKKEICYKSIAKHLSTSEEIIRHVNAFSQIYEVDFYLILSLIYQESRFNEYAINTSNSNGTYDAGLMQLNSRTFRNLSLDDMLNRHVNLRYGVKFLKWCLDEAGGEVPALAYYNCGIGTTLSGRVPESTENYIVKIISKKQELKNKFSKE